MEIRNLADLVEKPEGITLDFSDEGRVTLNFANETDQASTGISDIQRTIILSDILKAAQAKMFFLNAVTNSDAGIREKAVTVKLPLHTSNRAFTEYTTEATDRTWTEITNLTSASFSYALKKYGAIISKDVQATTATDVVQFTRDQLVYDVSLKIDTAIADALEAASSPAATLFGGDAVSTASLAAGDVLTPELVNKAQMELKKKDWLPEASEPFLLFVAPEQEKALMDDSQFVNASEYGSGEVVLNGEIGKYLGIKVLSTTQTPAHTTWGGGALAGHGCMLVKARKCGAIVWFEKPSLDGEYDKNKAATKIYLDTAYAVGTLNENAIVVINVSDA